MSLKTEVKQRFLRQKTKRNKHKRKNEKLDSLKIKKKNSSSRDFRKLTANHRLGEIFTKHVLDHSLVFRIYKEFL